jgi:Flp pilus assembly secretin CpaC
VQTSRNMVTANVRLRFNETLILSGLSEREITSMNSRTPFLGELPGLQYLFSRRDSQDFTRSVIIMLTPRRVASLNETLAGLDTAAASEAGRDPALVREMRRKALAELGGIWPNLSVTLRHMDRNRLFRAVRSGDLEMEDWERPDRIESLLTDLVGLLYH